MIKFTREQKSIRKVEIGRLLDRLSRRKAVADLPTLKQRCAAIARLRTAVANLTTAARNEHLPPAGWLSRQSQAWLDELPDVANELRALEEMALQAETNGTGCQRPNEYRQWLFGQIQMLFEKIFDGERLPLTVEGKNDKGKRGMQFSRLVLRVLGKKADVTDETIKHMGSKARRAARG